MEKPPKYNITNSGTTAKKPIVRTASANSKLSELPAHAVAASHQQPSIAKLPSSPSQHMPASNSQTHAHQQQAAASDKAKSRLVLPPMTDKLAFDAASLPLQTKESDPPQIVTAPLPPAITSLLNTLEALAARLQSLEHEKMKINNKLKAIEENMETMNQQVQRIRGVKRSLETTVNELGKQKAELDSEIHPKETEVSQLSAPQVELSNEAFKEKAESERERLKEDVQNAKKRIKQLQEEKEELNIKLLERDRMNSMAQQDRIAALQAAKQNSKSESEKLLLQITSLISSNSELESKVSQANEILQSHNQKYSSLSQTVESMNNMLHQLTEEQTTLKSAAIKERKFKASQTKSLEDKIVSIGTRIDELRHENMKLQEEYKQATS